MSVQESSEEIYGDVNTSSEALSIDQDVYGPSEKPERPERPHPITQYEKRLQELTELCEASLSDLITGQPQHQWWHTLNTLVDSLRGISFYINSDPEEIHYLHLTPVLKRALECSQWLENQRTYIR